MTLATNISVILAGEIAKKVPNTTILICCKSFAKMCTVKTILNIYAKGRVFAGKTFSRIEYENGSKIKIVFYTSDFQPCKADFVLVDPKFRAKEMIDKFKCCEKVL